MRHFDLLNLQHAVLWLVPTLIFMVVFYLALARTHLRSADDAARKNTILYRFPDGIEDRNAPFPLGMLLIVAGAVIWSFFYILMIGVLEVKI